MALFQKSVLNKYLNTLDDAKVKSAFKRFTDFFHNESIIQNIREDKEEQFQYGFLQNLFDEVLGYTINPKQYFNLTTEFKNLKGSKKADGAILKDGVAIGVIELKSTKTKELSKIEDQAFGYKRNQPNCKYVITSNFEKLRFYINDSINTLEFNLFTLSEDDFKLLYLCLGKDQLLSDVALKLKTESTLQEEDVTKKLYKDYSAFKAALFNDLVALNPQYDKLVLFKKSQKLIDRFLFILFAEDKGLLPPNSISAIVKSYDKLEELDYKKPLFDVFKQYFEYINTGRPKRKDKAEIFAYNGGLFSADEILDKIEISDEVLLRNTMDLTKYDFDTEVDVNILGHIFEHSLNEIEEITAELEGRPIGNLKSKRKKDGVFYTPKYITKYIVDNTLGKLCEEKKHEIKFKESEYIPNKTANKKKPLLAILDQYRDYLLSLTICDPACGSGAFLNQALDFLITEHNYIDELKNKLLGGSLVLSDVTNDILEKNLYGVDINEESIEIARLSLWLRSAKHGRALTTLSNNIKCGNSLIEDKEIAGRKAFIWKKEFPEIVDNGGFNVVIGNPPYVTKTFTEIEKKFFNDNYETSQYQLDLYVSFMELGIKLLQDKGIISFIVPNSWMKNLMFDKCRRFILSNVYLDRIIPNIDNVFTDASVDTMIFNGIKSSEMNSKIEIGHFLNNEYVEKHFIEQLRFVNNDKSIFDVEISKDAESIFVKIEKQCTKLSDISDVTRGINPYDKYRGQSEEIIKNKLYHATFKKNETFVPEVRGKHVYRYCLDWDSHSYVSYGEWLAAPREAKYFEGKRVICRQVLGNNLNCTFIDTDFIIDQSVFIAKFDDEQSQRVNPIFVLAQLTSKLIAYYFRYKANEFDALFPKIKIGEFKQLPIRVIGGQNQLDVISLAQKMLTLNLALMHINKNLASYLHTQFDSIILTKKLQNLQYLNSSEFIKELRKVIKRYKSGKLSKTDEFEWMQLFNSKKSEAQLIMDDIKRTDSRIDQLVYELYGLTKEEISKVEAAMT